MKSDPDPIKGEGSQQRHPSGNTTETAPIEIQRFNDFPCALTIEAFAVCRKVWGWTRLATVTVPFRLLPTTVLR